mmetsp:Transcript_38236/g.95022  ORF Transcript_38236/g.95022 Transcript_38236/m.95022 type:complete len:200 (-) Transcript_38236:858-1457(-)
MDSATVEGSLPPLPSITASTSAVTAASAAGLAASMESMHATVAAVVSCPATIISVSVWLTSSRVRGAPETGSRAVSSAVSKSCGTPLAPAAAMSTNLWSARTSKCARRRSRCTDRSCTSAVLNFWYSSRKSFIMSWVMALKRRKLFLSATAPGSSLMTSSCSEKSASCITSSVTACAASSMSTSIVATDPAMPPVAASA